MMLFTSLSLIFSFTTHYRAVRQVLLQVFGNRLFNIPPRKPTSWETQAVIDWLAKELVLFFIPHFCMHKTFFLAEKSRRSLRVYDRTTAATNEPPTASTIPRNGLLMQFRHKVHTSEEWPETGEISLCFFRKLYIVSFHEKIFVA